MTFRTDRSLYYVHDILVGIQCLLQTRAYTPSSRIGCALILFYIRCIT